MTLLTISEINDLNRTQLDAYFWTLYNLMSSTLQHKISKELDQQFNYVSNLLKK